MKKWTRRFLILAVLVFTVIGTQTVMASQTGTTDDHFKWMLEEGVMAITGYEGTNTEIVIPSKINNIPVTRIHDHAFSSCTGITNITIPNTVDTIGLWAFDCCTGLRSVVLPNSVKKLDSFAFDCCSNLKSITLSNSLSSIPFSGFRNCYSLEEVSIPASIKTIEWGAFYGCTSMSRVSIPKTVTSIFNNAFGYYKDALEQEHKVAGFTVYGVYGTKAELFAKNNDYVFIGTQNNIADVAEISLDREGNDYTGEEIRPKVEVIFKEWELKEYLGKLKEGVDYTVSYSNNVNPGTATVTVNGINHYSGNLTKTFTIYENELYRKTKEAEANPITIMKAPSSVKAKAKKNKVIVSWKKIKKSKKTKALLAQIKAVQIQVAKDQDFQEIVVNKSVGKNKKQVKVKLAKKTTYFVRVRYVGNGGYSNWSGFKRVTTK